MSGYGESPRPRVAGAGANARAAPARRRCPGPRGARWGAVKLAVRPLAV